MKNLMRTLVLLVVATTMLSWSAAAQSRDRVCFYENNYYHGWEQCFAPGDQIPDLGDHRNKISSIRVFGNAQAVVYANKNFQGATMDVTSDVKDLAQVPLAGGPFAAKSWNDIVESVQVRSKFEVRDRREDNREVRNDDRDRDDRDRDERRFPRVGACFFEQPEYRGRFQCLETREEVSDLGREWNNRISSIRVFGPTRVTLYREINYRGERVTIDRDIRDLRDLRLRGNLSWDNQVSSVDINGGRGHAYGRSSQ